MPHQPHLFARAGRFYWRRRIPKPLRAAFGRDRIVKSLFTFGREDAARRARRLDVRADALFREIARMPDRLPPQHIQALVDECVRLELDAMEEQRLADPATTVLETAGACRASHQIAAGLEKSLAVNDFATVEPLLADLVERRGLALAPGTMGWAELARSVMRGLIAAHRVDALRDLGVYDDPATPPAPGAGTAASPVASGPAPLMSVEWKRHVALKTGGDWKDEQATDAAEAWDLWKELIGDLPLDRIDGQGLEFREALKELPALRGRSVFTGLTLAEAIDRAEAIEAGLFDPGPRFPAVKVGQRVRRLSKATQNKHIDFIAGLFKTNRVRKWLATDPFEGVRWPKKAVKAERELGGRQRTNLSDAELVVLFGSPVWKGQRSRGVRCEFGDVFVRDALFWIPLICLWTGLRPGEALQLWLEDVVDADGAWWILVRRGPGRILRKSPAAVRSVPVPAELIRIGFIDFVAGQKAEGRLRLFPEWCAPSPDGEPERGNADRDAFSKAFGYYRRSVKFDAVYDDLQALRHTYITAAHNARILDRMIAYLVGHEGGAIEPDAERLPMTNRVYFGGYEPQVLVEEVAKIKYKVLDFSRLHVPGADRR
jgi:integrase